MVWPTKISISQSKTGSTWQNARFLHWCNLNLLWGRQRATAIPSLPGEGGYSHQHWPCCSATRGWLWAAAAARWSWANALPAIGGWPVALLLFSKRCVNPVILITEPAVLDDYLPCFFLPHMVEREEITIIIFWKKLKKLKDRDFTLCPIGTGQSKLTSFKSEIPCQVAFFTSLPLSPLLQTQTRCPSIAGLGMHLSWGSGLVPARPI